MPKRFWTDDVSTAVYLLNQMPSKVLSFKTPLQYLSTSVPLPTALMLPPRVFWCVVYVHLHEDQRTKLDPCAIRCIFWVMEYIKRDTDVMILPLDGFM